MCSSCDEALSALLHHGMCLVHVCIDAPRSSSMDLAGFAGSPFLCLLLLALQTLPERRSYAAAGVRPSPPCASFCRLCRRSKRGGHAQQLV